MWAVLTGTKVEVREGKPSLSQMQEAVGGYIEQALRMPSPKRKNVSVDAWVNEEGLLERLPISFKRKTDGSMLAGTIVITATNERNGDTVDATQDEIDAIQNWLIPVPTQEDYDFEPSFRIEIF